PASPTRALAWALPPASGAAGPGTGRRCRRPSSGPPQCVDQSFERGGTWLDHPELADEIAEVVEDLLAPFAAGLRHMPQHLAAQVLELAIHAFGREAMDVDEFVVVAIHEIPIHVEDVGEAAGEACAEVDAGPAEHGDDAAGHVLAAMVAGTFDHRDCARVAHREAFAGAAR